MKRLSLVVLALAACVSVPKRWGHPTKTSQDFENEKHECMAQAQAGTGGQSNPLIARDQQAQILMSCLKGKGWRPVPEPEVAE